MRWFLALIVILPASGIGQSVNGTTGRPAKKGRKGEFYFSWGYNTEWYTHSNVRISQPELGNDYTFKNVQGHDHKGWNEQFFTKALTIQQYNYRLG